MNGPYYVTSSRGTIENFRKTLSAQGTPKELLDELNNLKQQLLLAKIPEMLSLSERLDIYDRLFKATQGKNKKQIKQAQFFLDIFKILDPGLTREYPLSEDTQDFIKLKTSLSSKERRSSISYEPVCAMIAIGELLQSPEEANQSTMEAIYSSAQTDSSVALALSNVLEKHSELKKYLTEDELATIPCLSEEAKVEIAKKLADKMFDYFNKKSPSALHIHHKTREERARHFSDYLRTWAKAEPGLQRHSGKWMTADEHSTAETYTSHLYFILNLQNPELWKEISGQFYGALKKELTSTNTSSSKKKFFELFNEPKKGELLPEQSMTIESY